MITNKKPYTYIGKPVECPYCDNEFVVNKKHKVSLDEGPVTYYFSQVPGVWRQNNHLPFSKNKILEKPPS